MRRGHHFLSSGMIPIAAVVATLAIAVGCRRDSPTTSSVDQTSGVSQPGPVTPVRGPSVIARHGLAPDTTRLGQTGGSGPPPETARTEPPLASEIGRGWRSPMGAALERFFSLFREDRTDAAAALDESFGLTGADLYRLNCRSCHGPAGAGTPPEIPSYVGPVQGTSAALIRRRLEARGGEVDDAFVRDLAADGEQTLRERVQKGGERMPAFPHLEGNEVDALIWYLKRQADVPEATGQPHEVTQSVARVGEHLVKGSCHVCHDATGPGGGRMMMMRGVIPSLASFAEQKSPDDLVRKVREGASGTMGMMGAGRMPVYPYLTEEEILASYLYLFTYPPRP